MIHVSTLALVLAHVNSIITLSSWQPSLLFTLGSALHLPPPAAVSSSSAQLLPLLSRCFQSVQPHLPSPCYMLQLSARLPLIPRSQLPSSQPHHLASAHLRRYLLAIATAAVLFVSLPSPLPSHCHSSPFIVSLPLLSADSFLPTPFCFPIAANSPSPSFLHHQPQRAASTSALLVSPSASLSSFSIFLHTHLKLTFPAPLVTVACLLTAVPPVSLSRQQLTVFLSLPFSLAAVSATVPQLLLLDDFSLQVSSLASRLQHTATAAAFSQAISRSSLSYSLLINSS